MRSITTFLYTVLFLSIFSITAFADSRVTALQSFLSILSKNGDLNGSVLVAEQGKILYEGSYGYTDFPSRRLASADDLYPIASITKAITATAILQLVAAGKVKLDDTVAKYLDKFPYPNITIRHLLSHTSGMPSYNAFFDDRRKADPTAIFANEDFIDGINGVPRPPIYQPSEKWNYDNTNYIVLALIIEKLSGESYEQFVSDHVLKPAAMSQTRRFQPVFDPTKNNIRRLAIPHFYPGTYSDKPVRADSIRYITDYWKAYQFTGFGDYISTTHDLLKFDQALYRSDLVDKRLLNEAFTPAKLNDGSIGPGYYGLGWTVAKDDSLGKIVFASGGAIGLSCTLYRNVSKQQTAIVFNIARPNANYIASNLLKILNGVEADKPKRNLSRIYGKLLVTKGGRVAGNAIRRLMKDSDKYRLQKEDLITLGYELMGDVDPFHLKPNPRYQEAAEVFKICIELFPDYWNSFDSYGDVLDRMGNKKLAIDMYRRSIELNSQNESGKKALARLLESK